MPIKNKKVWIGVSFLVLIEQTIKLIINNKYLNITAPILPPFLYFQPMFNRDYSWVNSLLQLGVSKWIHIIVVSLMIIIIYLFYKYLHFKMLINKMINVIFIFVLSGATCSLIDKIFWDGSLDYIMLRGFFTFDLKDLYVNVSVALLVFLFITNNKVMEKFDNKDFVKDFAKYVTRNVRKLRKLKKTGE